MKAKKQIIFLLVMVLIFSGFPFGVMAANQSLVIQSFEDLDSLDGGGQITDEIIVIYQNQGSLKDLALTTSQIQAGDKLTDQVDILKVSASENIDALVSEISKNPDVLVAEKNSKLKLSALPNDPLLDQAWQFKAVGANQTWDQVTNEEAVVVAVLDSGLNTDHPDIADNITAGYDYVDGQDQVIDELGHGTAVSGCIAAITNNELGMAGVAGTANIKIAPYRVGGESEDDGEANLAYVCAALYHAANRPEVRVVNMSFCDYEESSILETAISYAANAGKILVAASGNEGDEAEAGQSSIPSAYENVISVGATDQENVIAYFSQYNDKVDLCAPGVEILTLGQEDTYVAPSGTSFSSPIVAGAAAVLVAADPTLTPVQVETLLKETALDLGGQGRDDYYGYGLIQLDKALAQVTPKDPQAIISYRTHVENDGWQEPVENGAFSGTEGQSLRLEAIEIKANSIDYDIGIKYKAHVQNVGWHDFVENGALSGTEGEALRLEAIELELTGKDADLFELSYQVHVQNKGWMDWVKEGQVAGTEGLCYRLEGIKIDLRLKGEN